MIDEKHLTATVAMKYLIPSHPKLYSNPDRRQQALKEI